MEEILLNEESIVGCQTLSGIVNIAVHLALCGEVLFSSTLLAVLVGVGKCLHDEDSVSQLDLAIAVCIAPETIACMR